MSRVYLSPGAWPELTDLLASAGHTLCYTAPDPRYGAGVSSHADLRLCKLAPSTAAVAPCPPERPSYPYNACMCAVVLEGFLIHRLDITDCNILKYCRGRGYREINVRQGYTRCSCLPVDGRSLITSDRGILRALAGVEELQVLEIREGFVSLPGFAGGFLGGTAGRVGDELVFNGDLSLHPDFSAISDFVASRGVGLRYFPGRELTDIGSIIEI